ncbi:MAG: NAD(P)/FAD-dependent oxidoreductase [Pseudomonadota bacterium]
MQIAIAGCGIGGLAAAVFLARGGHRVTIYERFDAPAPVGSGLVLQPVGLEMLAALDLRARAEALGHPIEALDGRDADTGRRVLDVRYDHGGSGLTGLGIHRATLFSVLFDAAQEAGIGIEPGCTLTGMADGQMTFMRAGTAFAVRADVSVDATGAGSPLVTDPGRALPFGALWATVPAGDTPQAAKLRQTYRGARYMAGILPIGRLPDTEAPQIAIFWSLPRAAYGAWRSAPLSAWKAEAEALWPEFAPYLESIAHHDDLVMAQYRHRTLRRPVAGSCVHLGDSWHATSPQLGQGANMALLDAAALATALGETDDVAAALAEYRRKRIVHVRLYQLISRVFTPLYQSESASLALLRDRVLAPTSRLPGIRWLLGRMVCGDLILPIRP